MYFLFFILVGGASSIVLYQYTGMHLRFIPLSQRAGADSFTAEWVPALINSPRLSGIPGICVSVAIE